MGWDNIDYCGDNDPAINGHGLWRCPEDDCGYQTDVKARDGLCPFCDSVTMKCVVEPAR